MEAKQLIKAFPKEERQVGTGNFLRVSEFFFDTIQGEGFYLGHPAAFLRLQQCTLNCVWCDTTEVWRKGNPYSFDELIQMIDNTMLADKLSTGQHLILTGGSPLLQQGKLVKFITKFISYFGFKPFIEIENECVLLPDDDLIGLIDCWNNSPKLDNSGNSKHERYDTFVIKATSALKNSWFKFVISDPSDWEEIEEEFLIPKLIRRDQVILMPEGGNRATLQSNMEKVVELAIRENVIYRSREHIVLWDRNTGV
jgi:7-carboxy-7-deazaguanine synthase